MSMEAIWQQFMANNAARKSPLDSFMEARQNRRNQQMQQAQFSLDQQKKQMGMAEAWRKQQFFKTLGPNGSLTEESWRVAPGESQQWKKTQTDISKGVREESKALNDERVAKKTRDSQLLGNLAATALRYKSPKYWEQLKAHYRQQTGRDIPSQFRAYSEENMFSLMSIGGVIGQTLQEETAQRQHQNKLALQNDQQQHEKTMVPLRGEQARQTQAAQQTPAMKNAQALAGDSLSQEEKTQLTTLLAKSGTTVQTNPDGSTFISFGGNGKARAPSGYRPTADGNLEATPGGPADRMPFEQAAKMTALLNAQGEVKKVIEYLFPQGLEKDSEPGHVIKMGLNIPWTDGRSANVRIKSAIDGVVRSLSGAAVKDNEWDKYTDLYIPSTFDPAETQRLKLEMLTDFVTLAPTIALPGADKKYRRAVLKKYFPGVSEDEIENQATGQAGGGQGINRQQTIETLKPEDVGGLSDEQVREYNRMLRGQQ
ncbi:MAG: hypothetical protein HQL52_19735 [Magnetococcales bacterium]|nr:hypothetical protein [Magnetococcales bacterium]